MRILKWLALAVYVLLTGFVFFTVFSGVDMPRWWFFSRMQPWNTDYKAIFAAVFVLSQGAIVFTTVHGGLIKPIGFIRLTVPSLIGSAFITTFLTGLFATTQDLLGLQFGINVMFDMIAFNWVAWFLFVYVRYYRNNRFRVLRNFTTIMALAAVMLLIVSALAHLDVRSRMELAAYHPGTSTTLSLIAGLWMLLWTLGPATAIIFVNAKYEAIYQEWRKTELEEKHL